MKKLVENRVLKDSAGADIDNVTSSPTSEVIEIPGLSGFGVAVSGTSVASVDLQLSADKTNWFSHDIESSPTLPYGVEATDTVFPYARVVLTTAVGVTARVVKVDE